MLEKCGWRMYVQTVLVQVNYKIKLQFSTKNTDQKLRKDLYNDMSDSQRYP